MTTLREIRSLLREDGTLILVLPREPWTKAPMVPDLNQHLYCWTFRTINNLLHRAGFSPTTNEMRYPLGWLAFLPIRTRFGSRFYVWLTEVGRVLGRNGELVLRAVPETRGSQ